MPKRKRVDDEQRTFELLVESGRINGLSLQDAGIKASDDLRGIMAWKRGQTDA